MNILLIYGGRSCEHDISVITACLAKGYFVGNLYSVYLTSENRCYLVPNDWAPSRHAHGKFDQEVVFSFGQGQMVLVHKGKLKRSVKIDVVVNCCHGQCGEDGAVAALCKLCNLPLVGSDIISGGVAMDKIFTKNALSALNMPVLPAVPFVEGLREEDISAAEALGYPLIVKPATLGSSIGISVCRSRQELLSGLELAFTYDKRVLCEKALQNFYELNCAAVRNANVVEVSRVERPYTTHDILTFQDKYRQNIKFAPKQEKIAPTLCTRVEKLTAEIYRKFGFGGVVRVDYLVSEDEKLFVNEINSVPGSLAYGLWQHKYSPSQYGALLVKNAVEVFEEECKLQHKFASDVLTSAVITKK